jgi:hypothetical protein
MATGIATRRTVEDRITAAMAEEIAAIREECIQDAVKVYEKKLREKIGQAAVNIADFYSVERIGTVLQVRIQTGETNGTSR